MVITWPSNNSGVYQIKNLTNNKIYIGSSSELKRRKEVHFSDLRCGYHQNRHLQSAWSKYGESSFEFEILITCPPELCLWYEQQFINQLNPEYNIFRIAGSPKGYKHTAESKKKIALASIGRVQSQKAKDVVGARYRGKTFSIEHRKKIGISHINKPKLCLDGIELCSPQGRIYKNMLTLQSFCREHNLDLSHMYKVIVGKRNSHKGWTRC